MTGQKHNINRFSPIFFQVGLICAISIVLLAFEWKFYDDIVLVNQDNITEVVDELIEVPPTQQPPPPPPKVVQPQIREVPDEEEIIEELEIELDVEVREEEIIEDIVQPETEIEIEEETSDEVFTIVEEKPSYKSGDIGLLKYITTNMKYPEAARRMGIEGRVFVSFIVEKNGAVTAPSIVKGIGAGCDEEAIRIVKTLPRWNPAKQRGRPVRSRVTIPMIFRLN